MYDKLKKAAPALALIMLFALEPAAGASDSLLYLEAQGIAGYSTARDKAIWYSRTDEDVMQKSSIGFDYIKKLSGESSDFGQLALQARLSYDEIDDEIQPQLYNAYFKYKYSGSDIWIGHDRPALGLSSYFDTHGQLLSTLPMSGFGFDRDWGVGFYRETEWGDAAVSLTTGSGMPVYFKGNYLASGRISKGSLNQDNYNIGLSVAHGETLETMGYELMNDEPELFSIAELDGAYLWDNYEARFELAGGRNMDKDAFAALVRFGVNLMDEGQLKLEFQPLFTKLDGDSNYELSLGTSYLLTPDITIRTMYDYDHDSDDHKIILQLYYYDRI